VAAHAVPVPSVRTLAGTGVAGNLDGPGDRAEFMFPAGIAYDASDGSIYVADAAGQRIRRVSADGVVSTVAGSGEPNASGLEVPGGFVDGAAAQARFDRPMGVAVAPDRSLYVADSANHCIRRIAGGQVTTFAGSPERAGSADGPRAKASFREPRGVAFDSDGTLYVADYGAGVRIVGPDGAVSTLALPADFAVTASSVAVWPHDEHALYVVGRQGMLRYNLSLKIIQGTSPPSYEENVGPYGVVALSSLVTAVSSPRYDGIYLHDGRGPDWQRIAGQVLHDPAKAGGFSDGPSPSAKFAAPLGLAADAQGNVLVADAGNRRIRFVPRVNPRWPRGLPSDRNANLYQIAYVSNSFAFKNTFWDDSIEAGIARRLNADRAAIDLPEPVDIDGLVFPDTPLKAQAQIIEELYGSGNVDLVVLSLNSFFFHDRSPSQPWFLPPDYSPQNEIEWGAILAHLHDTLAAAHTQLVLVDHPFGYEVGPAEDVFEKEDLSLAAYAAYGQMIRTPGFGDETDRRMEAYLSTLGIPHFSTYDRFVAYERKAHAPLFPSGDFHFSTLGNAFYADAVAGWLEQLKPWRPAASKDSVVDAWRARLASASSSARPAPSASPQPASTAAARVRTLAGNGDAGNGDGRGAGATFMYPSGVAYDRRNRNVYVADSAGQRIRVASPDGAVKTVAGGGAALPWGLDVEGGYVDGDVKLARFRHPSALALAPDGSLYVADSFNHCIRRIRNGRVETFAGDPRHAGASDGPRRSATFTEPRGLALAGDGTLYVADFTAGLRAVSPSGVVSTLSLPLKDVMDVAVWDRGGARVAYATTRWEGVVRFDLRGNAYEAVAETEQSIPYITPNGVAALGPADALVSSTVWQALTVVHFRQNAAQPPSFSAIVAGDDDRDRVSLGGFADGPADLARFYDPAGIAVTPDGDVIVADGGNRRVRVVAHLDPSRTAPPARKLHVALVADANVNWHWLPRESPAGFLERALGARVTPVLSDAASDPDGRALVKELAGRFDVVVWLFDARAAGYGPPAGAAFVRVRDALASSGAKLLPVEYPRATQLGYGEETYRRLFAQDAARTEPATFDGFDSTAEFARQERGDHAPLFASDADRLSVFGNAFVAELIAGRIKTRGWATAP